MSDEPKNDSALGQQQPSWGILGPPQPRGGGRFRELRSFLIPMELYRQIAFVHDYMVKDGFKITSEPDFLIALIEFGIANAQYTIMVKEQRKLEAVEKANAEAKGEGEAGKPTEGQDGDRSVPGDEVRAGGETDPPTSEPEDEKGA